MAWGTGCGGSSLPRTSAPVAPSELAKCKVAARQSNPMVTEWSGSEKGNLEAGLREGGVVVAYAGCHMRILTQCHVGGAYEWQRTTTATDVLEIESEDDLYTKLPLGAVSLEGELKTTGRLAVQTTVSGQYRLGGLSTFDVPTSGPCRGATHVVSSLSLGAFKVKSGGATAGRGAVGVSGVGTAEGRSSRDERLLRQAGDPDHCRASAGDDLDPACASPIQMFLVPLASAPREGPVGTMKVDFLAGTADRTWEVIVDDNFICSTPCTSWVRPESPLMMRAFRGKDVKGGTVEFPDLRAYAGESLEIRAHPRSNGKLVTGMTFTALGGVALTTGVVLTAAGCSSSAAMCRGGIITGLLGAAVSAGGIWLMLDSRARAEVLPREQQHEIAIQAHDAAQDAITGLSVGPVGVSGAF
jgi:hypothetical protein